MKSFRLNHWRWEEMTRREVRQLIPFIVIISVIGIYTVSSKYSEMQKRAKIEKKIKQAKNDEVKLMTCSGCNGRGSIPSENRAHLPCNLCDETGLRAPKK